MEYGVASNANSKFRKTMEDAHKIITPFYQSYHYFAIFDGHAGAVCAQQSAQHLHPILERELTKEQETAHALRNAFVNMDKKFENIANSGCTACVALVSPKRKLYVANVGDTRAVLCRGSKALRLSYDHKGSDENEKRRITNYGGLLINNRVNGVLAVTRALGDLYMKDYVIGEPYTTETDLVDEDNFVIVACDGIWDVCSDQQAVDIVLKAETPQKGVEELLEVALERGSMDNLTALVVRLRH